MMVDAFNLEESCEQKEKGIRKDPQERKSRMAMRHCRITLTHPMGFHCR